MNADTRITRGSLIARDLVIRSSFERFLPLPSLQITLRGLSAPLLLSGSRRHEDFPGGSSGRCLPEVLGATRSLSLLCAGRPLESVQGFWQSKYHGGGYS